MFNFSLILTRDVNARCFNVCCCRETQGVVLTVKIQGGSNMTGTDLYVNKPHCAAAVRP